MSQPASRPVQPDTDEAARAASRAHPPALEPSPRPEGEMWTMEEYRDWLLAMTGPHEPVTLVLADAVGLALGDDLDSPVSLPPFDNPQMDGFAVCAADIAAAGPDAPVALRVVGVVNAGDRDTVGVAPGTAVRIMTGAPLPPGADAVVPFEQCDAASRALDAGMVRVLDPVAAGQNVRRRGSDVTTGQRLMDAGDVVTARHVGLLAGCGIDRVPVRPRPRVLVLSTGAELVDPGHALDGPARIHDANSHLVAAAARAAGAVVTRASAHTDDPDEVAGAIAAHLPDLDLIVTTGGISEGDADVVKQLLPRLGHARFVRVAMQPGKPQGYAVVPELLDRTRPGPGRRMPVIALPGNPVSSYVSFHAFVRPVLRRMMGITPEVPESVAARAEAEITSIPGRMQFARGIVTDHGPRRSVRLAGGHGSHLLGDLARSNALVLIPAEAERVAEGEWVECWMLDEG